MGDLVADLSAGADECIETHISWVFLWPDEVFKLKKPVDFGFLDFTRAAARRAACEAEVELNSRLAPGVYRGVLPVRRDPAGVHRIAASGEGEVVDHVVHMERLPVDARADLRLERGALTGDDIDRVAQRLARFHAAAARGAEISAFGAIGAIRRNVEENFLQAQSPLRELAGAALEREVEERQLGFLETNAERFARRVDGGFIRDGHGDLRLEHVYLVAGREPVVIDCIEFNERFRYADVCADIAHALREALCDEPPHSPTQGGILRDGFDARVDELRALSRNSKDVILELEQRERERTKISSLKVRFTKVFGYYIEISKSRLEKVPADYKRKQTVAGGERFTTEELEGLQALITVSHSG